MESLNPQTIVELIPYNNLKNINYLTKGGFSEIYTADWINGRYGEWDSKEQQLKRFGTFKVVLKTLENVESANQSWLEEVYVVRCCGLTQNPSNKNYMLVMAKMDIDLRNYLQQNHNQLTWKDRMKIINEITLALYCIHKEKAIHRDLHSGNILYSQFNDYWYISDLGFCGPADKSSTSIYGNLPYIAPEVIVGREYTFASDIYSIAILMPKIVPGTPLEYKNLMKECWDSSPLKRPDIYAFRKRMRRINLNYQNMSDELFKSEMDNLEMNKVEENYTSSRLFTKEQEAFHSKLYDFNIPNNINDFNKSNEQNSSKVVTIFEDSNKKSSKLFKKLQINSNDEEKEIAQQQIKRQSINVDDDDEIYNNPNFHSKEQDELEIPD
ncbi:kinase-like protein, partial [Rhizophagus irregularis]